MKRIYSLTLPVILAIWSCTAPEAPKTTVLYYYTPYRLIPELLNRQIKSVTELTYSFVDNNGTMKKGNILSKKERDNLNWSYDFMALFDVETVV